MRFSTSKQHILTIFISFIIGLTSINLNAQKVAVLKYGGGGDWYGNPTALPNLVKYCNDNINTNISETVETVETGSIDIFQYPFIHMTGHGNVSFSDTDTENLRSYLLSGGFLHVDDNYGLKPFITKALKQVFPNKELEVMPKTHPIFNAAFAFPNGLPKIHEHDGKAPEALGLFHEGRLIVLLTLESDLGDGWEDPEVHNDPEDVRLKALKMGANIMKYVFVN